MGICASEDEEQSAERKKQWLASRQLDNTLLESNAKQSEIIKLLLLGAGESGKSTLFRALATIYGDGFSDDDYKNYITVVRNNTFGAMKTLLENEDISAGETQTEEGKTARAFFEKNIAEKHGRYPEVITSEIGAHVKVLWADPNIKKTYTNRSKLHLMDSAKYFFEHIDRICDPEFLPNVDDILQCRVRTTGIHEENFTIEGNKFKMVDVGGQRNERKKWIHCFEDVTGVIFVAALSEYDQMMFEDDETNRMVEALNLFEEMCNSQWFQDTSFLLFLNKKDLFAEKIKKVPLTSCPLFKDYTGTTFKDGCDYITDHFHERNLVEDKKITTYITCATDMDNVFRVFDTVKDIIIRASLRDAGLF